ncbi:2' O-ribose methyltransferase [Tulasnella sp. JGI-2019a]|nr:2' O-ribose methyltransferase [Tulasnella sp. JGI-2019a]
MQKLATNLLSKAYTHQPYIIKTTSIRHASGGGKSKSSKEWLSRQSRDPFVKQRNAGEGGPIAGYRARSAFKLLEMSDRFGYLMHGAKVVVDLGAAPGGWTQVVAKKMNLREAARELTTDDQEPTPVEIGSTQINEEEPSETPDVPADGNKVAARAGGLRRRTVIAVDLLPIKPIPGVSIIQGNFLSPDIQDQISALIPVKWMVDIVLSDMSPSISGNRLRDVDQSLELCTAALTFAKDWLVSSKDTGRSHSGVLVMKYFDHPELQAFRKEELQRSFHFVQNVKPAASRSESSEAYWVCSGFRRVGF